jgi:prepilin-type N-terminal cleavage/methylation domain-containing protein
MTRRISSQSMNQLNRGARSTRIGFRHVSSAAGFTLIEVMVAAAVMLVVFAGGFGALAQGNRLIEVSRDETRVSQILQSEIEDLRTRDWATLIALAAESSYAPQGTFTDAYSTRYSVKRNIATRSATQRRVTLQVSWTDNRNTSHMREYLTLITEDGLYDFYYRSF